MGRGAATARRAGGLFPARWKRRFPEQLIKLVLFLFSSASIFATVGIVSVLVFEATLFFQEVSIIEFLTGTVPEIGCRNVPGSGLGF